MKKRKIQIKRKEFRLSVADIEELERKAAENKTNSSAYLRRLIWNRPIEDIELKEKLRRLIFEINHIGTNINQIAHHLNAGGIYREREKQLIQREQEELEELVQELISYLQKGK